MTALLAAVVAYLIGGIPFGYLLVRMQTGEDVRSKGSGNIGATNVLRTTGRAAAVATLVLDIGKGCLAVWLAGRLTNEFRRGHEPGGAGGDGRACLSGLFEISRGQGGGEFHRRVPGVDAGSAVGRAGAICDRGGGDAAYFVGLDCSCRKPSAGGVLDRASAGGRCCSRRWSRACLSSTGTPPTFSVCAPAPNPCFVLSSGT